MKPNIATADATLDGYYAAVGLDHVGACCVVVEVWQRRFLLLRGREREGREKAGKRGKIAQHTEHRIRKTARRGFLFPMGNQFLWRNHVHRIMPSVYTAMTGRSLAFPLVARNKKAPQSRGFSANGLLENYGLMICVG